MEILIQSIQYVFTPFNLALVIGGTAFGMICGALPGLSASMSIILLLPFTYGMEPVQAIVTLVAVYTGAACGGSISAILLRTPGTPEAVATTFDGYPMAMRGQAGRALGLAVSASSFGGIFSALMMVLCAPLLATVALKFQSAEYFGLALLGLSCITSIGSKNQLKAIFACLMGLLLSTVGLDEINGLHRFVYGSPFLMNGINYIPVMIGSFALAEVYKIIEDRARSGGAPGEVISSKVSLEMIKLKELLGKWITLIKSSIIGTVIGIVPAAGGAIAALVAYGEASRSSKTPEEFGKGIDEGILAPESANNAAVGGSMVPTMVLGIPGSPTAAVIMAAFMIHGLRPGPLLLKDQPILLNAIFIGLILASLLLFVVGRYITRQFARILKLPYPLLGTLIIVLGIIGAYALKNSFYDILLALIFSVVGYFFDRYKFSNSAMILGLILGSIAENSLRKQLIVSEGSLAGFFTRPIALVVVLFSLIAFISPFIRKAPKGRS
ncbi:MAG: tripartite tricarboxylate transporter permease [Spirochaetaceae bacterium]|jgi:putative tricarboxylic transport membrane protein|nr:tripartite tricarboxylate transporter permease [Spirochaetaceae bacterium]